MWIKKLKQKKLQFTLIALILMCITSIFSGCLSFTLEIQNYIKDYYSEDVCPEYFFTSKGEEGINALREYEQKNKMLKELFLQEARLVEDKIKVNGTVISTIQPFFVGLEDMGKLPYFYELKASLSDKKLIGPEQGTLWISSVFADLKGYKLGDTLEIDRDDRISFIIGGIYNAAICPSSTMSFFPFYINIGDMQKMDGEMEGYFGNFTRKDQTKELSGYLENLPKDFIETVQVQYDRGSLELSFTMVTSILAGIGIAASFLIFLVSIIIIRFIIKSNLIKEFRSIGIYKSLGFQSKEIIGFYMKYYLFAGVTGIGIGSLLGLLLAKIFSTITVKYLGEFHLSYVSVFCALALILFLTGVLVLNLFAALKKIKKISPVKALNMEMISSKSKLKRSFIKNAHSPFAMAINDICKRRGSSFMMIGMLTVSFYLSIFFLMVNSTMENMDKNITTWFAIPDTGCFVSVPITEQIQKKIEKNRYVEKVIFGQLYMMLPLKSAETEEIENVTVFSYTSFDQDITGIHYIEGREPKRPTEIALSKDRIDQIGLCVGDYIKLEINQVQKDYLITGSYRSMMNNSNNMQIPLEVLNQCKVPYQNKVAFVKLKESAQFPEFQTEIEETIEGAVVTRQMDAVVDSTKGITEIVSPVTMILIFIFLGFSFLNIVNLLLMNHIDNRRKYGILKALGFTNGYIRWQSIIKIIVLAAISSFFAILIHFAASAKIFTAMIGVDGLSNNIPLMSGLIGIVLLSIVLIVLLFSIPLSKITPTDLMEE